MTDDKCSEGKKLQFNLKFDELFKDQSPAFDLLANALTCGYLLGSRLFCSNNCIHKINSYKIEKQTHLLFFA